MYALLDISCRHDQYQHWSLQFHGAMRLDVTDALAAGNFRYWFLCGQTQSSLTLHPGNKQGSREKRIPARFTVWWPMIARINAGNESPSPCGVFAAQKLWPMTPPLHGILALSTHNAALIALSLLNFVHTSSFLSLYWLRTLYTINIYPPISAPHW